MRRMQRITGRNDDMIILRGVNLFPSQIEELVMQIPELSPHFVLELTRPAQLDALTIRIELRDGVSTAEGERAIKTLGANIKTQIGCSVGIVVVDQHSLARSEGKLQRLYDLRGA
jgi:phenylacetate-CoA ligase